MELTGRIILDLPLQQGTSKAGNAWMKKEWVLETPGQYPKKVKFHVFGQDRINANPFEVGRDYTIQYDIESREFNGRWYTDISVYSSRPADNQAPAGPGHGDWATAAQPTGPQFGQPASFSTDSEPAPDFGAPAAGEPSDDLPF